MFSELEKYKNNGHFIFKKGDKLRTQTKNVPNEPGVYLVHALKNGNVELVYLGKSGSLLQNGSFKGQMLNGRINNKQEDMSRQAYFNMKMEEEGIEALDVYWYVTFNNKHQDLPGFVEATLLQRHFETFGELPKWNKSY